MMSLRGSSALAAAGEAALRQRRALADFPPLHGRMAERLQGWVARNFADEGAALEEFPSGWPPLAPATLEARSRRNLGDRPLDATGRLRRGIAIVADGRGVSLDNDVPYAARHQLGLGVPRRPFLPGAADARGAVLPEVEAHVRAALGEREAAP